MRPKRLPDDRVPLASAIDGSLRSANDYDDHATDSYRRRDDACRGGARRRLVQPRARTCADRGSDFRLPRLHVPDRHAGALQRLTTSRRSPERWPTGRCPTARPNGRRCLRRCRLSKRSSARVSALRPIFPACSSDRAPTTRWTASTRRPTRPGCCSSLPGHGYLRHHRVEAPSARGFFIDGRYPHATAVLTDTDSGERWAVDFVAARKRPAAGHQAAQGMEAFARRTPGFLKLWK